MEDAWIDQEFESLSQRSDNGVSPSRIFSGPRRKTCIMKLEGLCSMKRGERIVWLGCAKSSGGLASYVRSGQKNETYLTILRLVEYSRRYCALPQCSFIPSWSK